MPEADGSLGSTDLAILSARADVMRCGASRANFCPEDVEGSASDEPGEYIWKEYFPPTTQWTLQTEGRVCGERPIAGFSMVGETVGTVLSVTWAVVESEAGAIGESWDYTFTPTVVGGTAPYTYAWDFDDGEPDDTNETPTQVWARAAWTNPDDITVTLTVTDDDGTTAVYTDVVTVQFNE